MRAAWVLGVLLGVALSLLGALAAGGYVVWLMARNTTRALDRLALGTRHGEASRADSPTSAPAHASAK
jgi:hypothetical protein